VDLSPFGAPALASWAILDPPESWAFLTVGLPATPSCPDPDGVSTFHMRKLRPGWAPPMPRGRRCSHGWQGAPNRRLPLLNGQSLHPAPCIPPARLTLTRRHRRFTCVCPSGLPLAGDPRVERRPLGLNPELRTPPLPAAHVRAGTGAEHSPGTTSSASPTLHTINPLAACDLVSHHLTSALRLGTDNGFDTVIVPGQRALAMEPAPPPSAPGPRIRG
jgi:hypothetical protein